MVNAYILTEGDNLLYFLGKFSVLDAVTVANNIKESGFIINTYDRTLVSLIDPPEEIEGEVRDYKFSGSTFGATPDIHDGAAVYIRVKPVDAGDDAE